MSQIVIDRNKLQELITKGVHTYENEKNLYGASSYTDCIMREIETYLAFDNGQDFMKELIGDIK